MEFKNEKLKNIYSLIFGKVEESAEPIAENVETSENVEQKFLDATLEDGTMVQIEPALEVGAAVIVIDAEGNPMAAPDGSHTLLDGTVIETAEGLITNIVEAEAEEVEAGDEEKEEEMSNDTTETQEQKVKKVVESIIKESHFAKSEAIEEAKKELREEFKAALEAEVKAIAEMMFGAFEEFGKEEAEEPKAKPAKFNTKKKKKSWVDNFKG